MELASRLNATPSSTAAAAAAAVEEEQQTEEEEAVIHSDKVVTMLGLIPMCHQCSSQAREAERRRMTRSIIGQDGLQWPASSCTSWPPRPSERQGV